MRAALVGIAAVLVVAVAAGIAWLVLAQPAQLESREQGLVLTEAASRAQFGVVVVFVLVGAVVSFTGAAVCAWLLPTREWFWVPVFALAAGVASLVAWQVGVRLGPGDPVTDGDVRVGDTVSAQLAVDAVAPFLVWPLFALLGLLFALWLAGDRGEHRVDESSEVTGGDLDVESTSSARHEHGRP